ncbi:TIGR00730 family Rossman fold protein [Bacillus sp. AFS001701]|uniref:LOG family protein n=1 Tax=Bacillaceae TaxID=186817 RepID=UPI000BF4AC50|nr:TIGR00730 family Rossman fold protein [Bacillus sp. AFS001701]PET68322.1 TIGR00730 family Rossman fold protein [Bacillus sp. AFS001701]
MKKICVYAGSNLGNRESFSLQAKKLGALFASNNIDLIYGGSRLGIMAEIANEVLKQGGNVIGIMPGGLFRGEVAHKGLTQFIETKSMHERKALMNEMSDGFIALPGGIGTFDELFEIICWAQIGIHNKPIGLLNVDHFFSPVLDLLKHAVKEGFMNENTLSLFVVAENADDLLKLMQNYEPPVMQNKWKQLEGK